MAGSTNESKALPFVRGGLAGCLGWLVVHPADVIKVRMQVSGAKGGVGQYAGPLSAARAVAAKEGAAALYSGLSAALTRQLTYTTLRLGLYETLRDRVTGGDNKSVTFAQKIGIGLTAGGLASAASTPVEVSMVRMYADGAAAPALRRGYRHIGDALTRIAREEGVRGLWAGATPTIARSMLVNCVQLSVYDQAKESIKRYSGARDGVAVHFAASLTSGYCYSLVTLPVDLAKTRVQNERVAADGTRQYRNIVQAMMKIARDEGTRNLWRGFTPYFARCGGHTIAMFLALEQVRRFL